MIALVGNPNTGKSTLFNALGSDRRARVSNLTGTTVAALRGRIDLGGRTVDLLDIPGIYSLAGQSPDEWVAIRSVLGIEGERPDLVLFVADAVRLERSLYLALQLLELRIPMVVAVNLLDEARRQGLDVDTDALARDLGVPVVGVSARTGEGLERLRSVLVEALERPPRAEPVHGWSPALERGLARLQEDLPSHLAAPGMAAVVALVLDGERMPDPALDPERLRAALEEVEAPTVELVQTRYRWLDAHAPGWRGRSVEIVRTFSDRVDAVVLHPVWGSLLFVGVMLVVFTALFSWSDPLVGMIEDSFAAVGGRVEAAFGPSPAGLALVVRDFVVQGLIGGVGSVLVFVPQIGLLFLFLALLEDSGYLARAAHLADRVLRLAGLPGRAFVPLLSGYACAVPAILATRTLPRFRDRLLTMMVIPFTSCSARLPVYTLVIATVFPATVPGVPVGVRPLALLAMYAFSTVFTVLASIVLGRFVLPAEQQSCLIELVPYRVPSVRVVLGSTWRAVREFIREAGGVILVATLVLWALLYFPRVDGGALLTPSMRMEAERAGLDLAQVERSLELERSFAGRAGKLLEPAIAPLGFDWRTGVGLIGAFAAREVFVSTLGVMYGIGEGEARDLRERLRQERNPDGSPHWTPLTGMSLMVFFALAMQCMSTLAVLVKETRGYRWPAFVFVFMTAVAWLGAFVVYQGGRALGLG